MKNLFIASLVVIAGYAAPARCEGTLNLQLNIASHHFDAERDFNESNRGVGIEFELAADTVRPYVAAGTLVNSMNDRSWYLGGGHRFAIGNRNAFVALGYFAGLLTYPSSGESVIPAVLPTLQIGSRGYAVSAIYVPRIGDKTTAAALIQARVPL